MSAVPGIKLMNTEEMLAIPDDGIKRWLIRGHLRESSPTIRDRWHGKVLMRLA
jgi:hypothetical protein